MPVVCADLWKHRSHYLHKVTDAPDIFAPFFPGRKPRAPAFLPARHRPDPQMHNSCMNGLRAPASEKSFLPYPGSARNMPTDSCVFGHNFSGYDVCDHKSRRHAQGRIPVRPSATEGCQAALADSVRHNRMTAVLVRFLVSVSAFLAVSFFSCKLHINPPHLTCYDIPVITFYFLPVMRAIGTPQRLIRTYKLQCIPKHRLARKPDTASSVNQLPVPADIRYDTRKPRRHRFH